MVNVDAYGVIVFYNVKIHNAYIYHNIIFPLSSDLYQKSVGGMRRKMASEKLFKKGVLFLHLTDNADFITFPSESRLA